MPKRTTIAPRGRKRYVRRDQAGQFTDKQVSVGRSLSQDRRRNAKTVAKPGYGDQGDRRVRKGPKRSRPRATGVKRGSR
jgi:hypothetical protein